MARLSQELKAQVVARLAKLRAAGPVPAAVIREIAADFGAGERTLWRWLSQLPAAARNTAAKDAPTSADYQQRMEPKLWRLSEADREAFHAAGGNAAAAWTARQAAGAAVPSLRTFQRAVVRELTPMERAVAAQGLEGQRRHTVYLRWEAGHRNQRWEADHFQLDVLVLPPRATRPVRPWLTVFVDAYSRLVMGWALAVTPSSATVLAALRQGLLVDPDRGSFGGLPGCLRPDRGLEFAATVIRQAAFALNIALLPAPPYSPHLKGKVERLGGTLAGDLRVRLPAATTRPAAREGQAVPITLEGLAGELHDWVAAYHTRPHGGLGGATPLQRWRADPTPVRQVDPAQVRWLLLSGEERRVTKFGIRFGGRHYTAPELNGRVGQTVQVRWMPHDHRELEVYLNGQWLCTAIPQDALGPAEREAVLARRREDAKELARRRRRVRRAARERLAPLTAPEQQVEDVTVIGRAQADREQRRHDDAALARLARTDLLGLEAIGEQIQARNRAKLAAHAWSPPRRPPASDEHDAERKPESDD